MPRAQIATKQAKFTLLRLHAELGGKIKENKVEARRLAQAMRHVEAVLKLLAPGYDVRPIAVRRRRGNPWFKRGTLLRHSLDVLRAANRPLTVREIALAMLAKRGVTGVKPKAVADLRCSVQSSLRNHEGKSVVENKETSPARWSIKL